jgi:hypothetical protein
MIVRISIHPSGPGRFDYAVSSEGEDLYGDAELGSFVHCLAAAIEGMGPDVKAAELAFGGIVSGTYPLRVLATRPAEVAQHAVNTTAAILEVERD